LAAQLDALHPAVLRLIERTVAGALTRQRPVGVCGALASDADAVPVLIGLGINELSVSVPAIPRIKARIRALSMEQCRSTARAALNANDASDVRALVSERHGETR
jgi:phosphoenolpyruvate-protein kinase (PTS system EI component)